MSDKQLFHNLVVNLMFGATLGALFVMTVFFLNDYDVARLLQHSTSPVAATVILITAGSMYFSFGAALTGFHFAIMAGVGTRAPPGRYISSSSSTLRGISSSALTAEMWTKTSLPPVSGWMKPYPLG